MILIHANRVCASREVQPEFKNQASSVRVPGTLTVWLYQRDNWQGPTLRLDGPIPCMELPPQWNDRVVGVWINDVPHTPFLNNARYLITNKQSGQVLDIHGDSRDDIAPLIQ